MDFNQILETVIAAVEKFIESGAIEKIMATVEKALPVVIETITSLVGSLSA